MSTKFEQLLDLLVNEEMDKANELFHEIVVEKSREIYENMIAEEEKDDDMEEAAEESDESVEEAAEDDDMEESVEEEDNMDESEELEDSYMMDADDAEDDGEMGGDAADDMLGDVEVDGGDDSDKSEDEAIMDIKNAIAELEAAFADLEAAQGGDMGMDSEFGDEEDGEDSDEKDEMMGMVREYRETVSKPSGDVAGANTGDKMSAAGATKSPISSGSGKPTTGADSKNILAKGATSNEDGTAPKGKVGGLVKSGGEFTKGVEKNIAGSANAKMKSGSDLSKQGAGYPGNNKTAGPVGSGKGDKAGQTSVHNTPSPLNGAPNRNA